mmetsp:Transcript_103279/g.298748  ORF Transcript_103279/g.298748 Transcript_103279/m.298748 type:complete len:247 (-) Transcript_103279:1335-2075(-)
MEEEGRAGEEVEVHGAYRADHDVTRIAPEAAVLERRVDGVRDGKGSEAKRLRENKVHSEDEADEEHRGGGGDDRELAPQHHVRAAPVGDPLQRLNELRFLRGKLCDLCVLFSRLRQLLMIPLDGLRDLICRDERCSGLSESGETCTDCAEHCPESRIVVVPILADEQRSNEGLWKDTHKKHRESAENHLRDVQFENATSHARWPVRAAHEDGHLAQTHAAGLQDLLYGPRGHRVHPHELLDPHALA